jgi:hypothetical protein
MSRTRRTIAAIALAVLLGLLAAVPAHAGEALWVVTGTQLQRVPVDDYGNPTPGSARTITGLTASETIESIAVRPATGDLYLLANDVVASPDTLHLYRLDPLTGAATAVGPAQSLGNDTSGNVWAMDINPVADVVRVVSPAGRNLRLTFPPTHTLLDDTPLAYAPGDPNQGSRPNVRALAYDSAFPGATGTTLYDLDFVGSAATPRLVRQGGPGGVPSPVSGMLFTVGSSGAPPTWGSGFDFDVSGQTGAAYTSYAREGPSTFTTLHRVDLATGTFSPLPGAFQTAVQTMALAPSSALALAAPANPVPESGGAVVVPVTRSGPGKGTVTVGYATSDGSATSGSDYTPTTGELTIPEGATSALFTVPIAADTADEGTESFVVRLFNPEGMTEGGAVVTRSTADVIIQDDDAPQPIPPAPPPPAPPAPDRSSPTIALSGVPSSTTLSKFLAGFKLSVTPSEPATVEVTLQGTTTKATIAAYELTLFSRTLVLAAGKRTLAIKPNAKLVGKPPKSVKVRLRIVAVDAAGNRRTSDSTITVKPDPKPKKKRKTKR